MIYEDPTLDFELEEEELKSFSEGDSNRSDLLQHIFGKLLDKKKRIAVELSAGNAARKS
ncbi:MAG: hypothetical protein IBX71_09545 [Candidatus Desulforudis sp.]|nr:hypothetical protein [Desulforudis sp.]